MYLRKTYIGTARYRLGLQCGGLAAVWRWALRCLLVALLCAIGVPSTLLFARSTPSGQSQPLVTQEIRYRMPDAGEVFLVWGLDGWSAIPETQRPAGTIVKNSVMYTAMARADDVFVVQVQVPPGATIDYAFQISKTRNGAAIDVWDANGEPKQDYHTVAASGGVVEVQGSPALLHDAVSTDDGTGGLPRGILLLLIGVCLVVGVGTARIPLNNRVIDYLVSARSNVLKLVVFALATRLILFLIGWLAFAAYANPNAQYMALDFVHLKDMLSSFRYADVEWYIGIAQNGYEQRAFSAEQQANWAFYPLWPIALRLGSLLFPNMVVVGIALSTVMFVLAIVYLYRLITLDFDEHVAMTTAVLAVIFPAAYFCSRPGPESLFLLLVVASFFYARQQCWILAGVLGGLAVLTRLQGVVLFLPLAYIYYQQYRSSRQHRLTVLSLLLIPAALFGFMFYLYVITGNFFANIAIQDAWGNHSSYPFGSIIQYLSEPSILAYYGWDLSIVSFIFAFLSIILTILMIRTRDIPREYIIYAILSIFIIVSRDTTEAALRYLIPVFPVYLMTARLISNRKMSYNLVFFTFVALQLFYFVSFIQHYNWAAT